MIQTRWRRLVAANNMAADIEADSGGDIVVILPDPESGSPLVHLRMIYGGITLKTLPKETWTAEQ